MGGAQTGIAPTGHEILPHISSWSLNGGFTSIDPRVAPAVDFFGIDSFRHETAVDSNNFVAQLAPEARRFRRPFQWPQPLRSRDLCQCDSHAGARRWTMGTDIGDDAGAGDPPPLPRYAPVPLAWRLPDRTGGATTRHPLPIRGFDYGPGINFEPWWTLSRYLRAGIGADLHLYRTG